jgi:hypothetical protein
VIGRKEGAKRRETGEEKLIGWRGCKIEAGGRKERAKREKVWGGDTRCGEEILQI